MENRKTITCYNCGCIVEKKYSVCPRCGAQLSGSNAPGGAFTDDGLQKSTTACPFCGKPVNWWDGKCPYCGEERFAEEQDTPTVYLDAEEADNFVLCETCGEYFDKRYPHICADAAAKTDESAKMRQEKQSELEKLEKYEKGQILITVIATIALIVFLLILFDL